ncbi:MAG: hypothetical protein AB1585_17810 [Thermodesulfobacteriota bacterium]
MKKLSCKKILVLNEDYAQNLLGEDQITQVKNHWAICPDCRQAYEETREVLSLLKRDHPSDPGPVFWEKMSARIMRKTRQREVEVTEAPWYLKIFRNPFGWPGYAWAAALILILLVPIVFFNINNQEFSQSTEQPLSGREENKFYEMKFEPLSAMVDSLSDKESARLAGKVVARLGKELSDPPPLLTEEETHWDITRSTERLTEKELEVLIEKMEPDKSAEHKEEETNAC